MTALEPFLFADFLGTATWLWLVFIAVVISLLAFDLGVLHLDNREICCSVSGCSSRRAATPAWITSPAF